MPRLNTKNDKISSFFFYFRFIVMIISMTSISAYAFLSVTPPWVERLLEVVD